MDRHLLQFSAEGQSHAQGLDPLLQSAILSMPSYQRHALTSSPHTPVLTPHDRLSIQTSIANSQALYNTHLPQQHPLQIYPQLPSSILQQPSPTTPQTPHETYSPHHLLSASSQPQSQMLVASSVPQVRPPPVPLRPMPPNSPATPDMSKQQQPQPYHSSSEDSPPGPRGDRLGRLGSHGGVGRRIILASGGSQVGSSAGNASSSVATSGSHNQATKDASGKFPCVHCHKTYLHLKHLKRHLLRHTGDRPYQCVLCKDTFSRSDILKRHFQKCSIRRGNPGNLTHLAHAHDHQRKKGKNGRDTQAALDSASRANDLYSSMGEGPNQGLSLPNGDNGKGRVVRPCDCCYESAARCDGSTPCARCHQSGIECTYSKDRMRGVHTSDKTDSGMLSSSAYLQALGDAMPGLGGREVFNFPPPTHPHAHLQHHPQLLQVFQQAPSHLGQPVQSSPPYTPVTDSPYVTNDSSQALLAQGYEGSYNFHQQVRLQHKSNPISDDAAKAKAQSEANGLGMSQSDQSLMYFQRSTPAQLSPNGSTQDLDWNFPNNDRYYPPMTPSIQIPPNAVDGSGLFQYPNTTPISLIDGIMGWNIPIQQFDPIQAKCDHLRDLLFSDSFQNHNRLSTPESPSSSASSPLMSSDDSDLKQWLVPHHVVHFVELYRTHFQTHFPAIHIPSFELTTCHDGVLLALICHGAAYSDRGITTEQVRRLVERALAMLERDDPRVDWRTKVISTNDLQARVLLSSLCAWRGSEQQRDRARKSFGKLINIARNSDSYRPLTYREAGPDRYSYYHHVDSSPKGSPEWNWSAWVEQETRNRIMFGIYLLDSAFVIYFNEKPRIGLFDLRITLPSDDAPWEATSAEECASLLGMNGTEAAAKNVAGTRQVKQPEFSRQMEELLTIGREFRIGTTNAYSKFILIHAIHVYIWQKQKEFAGQQSYSGPSNTESGHRQTTQQKNLQISQFNQTVAQALEKWRKAWDVDITAQYGNVRRQGFCRDGIAFYWLAMLFTRQKRRDLILKDVKDRQVVAQVLQMLETVKQRPKQFGAAGGVDKKYGVDELAFDLKLLFVPIDKESGSDGEA